MMRFKVPHTGGLKCPMQYKYILLIINLHFYQVYGNWFGLILQYMYV